MGDPGIRDRGSLMDISHGALCASKQFVQNALLEASNVISARGIKTKVNRLGPGTKEIGGCTVSAFRPASDVHGPVIKTVFRPDGVFKPAHASGLKRAVTERLVGL